MAGFDLKGLIMNNLENTINDWKIFDISKNKIIKLYFTTNKKILNKKEKRKIFC